MSWLSDIFGGDSSTSTSTRNEQTTLSSTASGADSRVVNGQTVTYNDVSGDVVKAALDANKSVSNNAIDSLADVSESTILKSLDVVGNIASDQIDANQTSANLQTAVLRDALAANSELASNVQSGGADRAQKTLNIVLIGILGLAAFFIFRKKS